MLHWHAVDDQSWPLEVPGLPDLAAKGTAMAGDKFMAKMGPFLVKAERVVELAAEGLHLW